MLNLIQSIPISYYIFSSFINFCTSLSLSFFILIKNPKPRLNRTFSLFALTVAQWSLFVALWEKAGTQQIAGFYLRTCMAGVIFMPPTFTHFVDELLSLKLKPRIILGNYFISLLILLTLFTPLYAKDGGSFLVFPFWFRPGIIFPLHLLHFFSNVIYTHHKMWRGIKSMTGQLRNQIRYVFIGTSIGYLAGSMYYFCWYRIPLPPFLNILISVYIGTVAYAIVRYRLLDIKVALTRATVFILVYTPVLALPFIIGTFYRPWLVHIFGQRWWIGPPIVSTFLATVGPSIYLWLQRRAENRLLREQRRYQDTLLNASRGMTRIRELNKLLSLIVHIITKTVRISSACIYLFNERTQQFELMAVRDRDESFPASLPQDEALIQHIISKREPLVYEELKQRLQEQSATSLQEIDTRLKDMHSAVVVPSFVEDRLLGFISLGVKLSGAMYTQDDLYVFTVLMNQAGIAIDNAQAYQELRATQHKLIQAEKLAAIGSFSSGIIHEIKNPLTAIKTFSEFLEEKYDDPEFRAKFSRIVKAETERINDIVQQLLEYAKPVAPKLEDIDITQVIEETLNLIEADLSKKRIRVEKNFPAQKPSLRLDSNQMKQVFLNLFNNAVEAMPQEGVLAVTVNKLPDAKYLAVEVADSGSGIAEEDLPHIFKPFYSTKFRNTGLGLSIVHAIIRAHQGEIKVKSKIGEGTHITLNLPL